MAKHILKFDEFELNGNWFCAATKEIGKIGNQWYTPARAMNMELVDYVEMLINKFHPDYISFKTILIFYWKKQSDMRLFKNWLNKRMREVQFYVE